MERHTGEKPYHCCQCNETFSMNNHFTDYMRTHTGEKLYQFLCDKAFYDEWASHKPYKNTQWGETIPMHLM